MIDREKIEKAIQALETLQNVDKDYTKLTIRKNDLQFDIYTNDWWKSGTHWTDEERHANLGLLTPLVGKLEKKESDKNIGYAGEKDGISVNVNYVDQCKILGYKTVTKTVKKEIEREPEYEEVEEEQQIAITDCDIRTGRFKEDDIEVTA